MSALEDLQVRVNFWVKLIAAVMVISVISISGTLVYWATEKDPLIVEQSGLGFSVCKDRKFTFSRYVASNKPLDIYVQNRWHDTDKFMDVSGIEGEYVLPRPDHYPLDAGFAKVMAFRKTVPEDLPAGNYEYRPVATYKVNPIKTITRPLPVQQVQVVCDYDPIKHGANK